MLSLVIVQAEDREPTELDPSAPGVNVWRSPDGQPVAFSSTKGDRRWLDWPGVAIFEFSAGREYITAIPYQPARPDLITEAFHHSVLPLALQSLGREAIHASAVLTPQGVVGFCGHAEVGKSTMAYALSQRGYLAWSDDAVVFEIDRQRPRALRLPFEFRLRPLSAAHFGKPAHPPSGTDDEANRRAPIAALCVLTRQAVESPAPGVLIARLEGRAALTAVLEHALCFDWHDAASKRQLLVHYLSLASAIRVFDVRLQPSLEQLSHVVDAIVDRVIAPLEPRVPLSHEVAVVGPGPEPAGVGGLRY
jgi:hypothetical protein